jgi:TRAP-type mannitol/chloroaromatic compound transport system permease small subunit
MIDTFALALKGIGWIFLPVLLLPLVYLFWPNSKRLTLISEDLITIIDGLSYRLGEITKWAMPFLVISVAFSVFALSIFGLSWTKLSESAAYLHASTIMLGAAATLLAGQHVRVDIFHSRMSDKARARVDIIGYYVFLLPVTLTILWNSQSFVNFGWRIFEGSNENDGIRGVFLLKTLIPIFCLTMIAQGLSISLRAAMCLEGKTRPPRPAHTPPLFPARDTHKQTAHGGTAAARKELS